MSNGQNPSGSGGTDPSQSEITPSPSGCQSADAEPSSLVLTVENVKKLQEEYPVAKSALARQSLEEFIQRSNSFLNEGGYIADRSKKQNLPNEQDLEATFLSEKTVFPLREDSSENIVGNSEEKSSKDIPTRSLPSSVPEAQTSKKREVADLETQTEWSYSDTSVDSSTKAREKLQKGLARKEEGKEGSEGASGMTAERRREMESVERFTSAERDIYVGLQTLFEAEGHSISDICHLGCCEFCASMLKPLPTAEELEEQPETVERFICCRTYKEIFQCVIQELIEHTSPESEIDINPHPPLSRMLSDSRTKKQIIEALQERGFENYREIFEQYIKFGTCVKVKFRLSDYPPKPKKVVLKKRRPRPEELLKIDVEFKAEHLKICHPTKPVKRYYPDGKIFSLLFPDGTGQVYYPSGNIATLITYVKEVQFTYIILNDSLNHEVKAFFTNQGYAACYHQNGHLRLHLNLCSGSCFDENGIGQKHWNWWDTSCHVHAPPFQTLCIQLNVFIHIKIEGQDQIFLTFTKVHDYLQLNVGSRLKLQDLNMLPFLRPPKNWGQLIRDSKTPQIRSLLANLHKLLKKLCCTPSEQTEDPNLIVSALYHHMQSRCKMATLPKQGH